MTVAQQARDAAAIIKTMGADKATVFGSSGGAIIWSSWAAAIPKAINFLIVDEAPAIELLPETDADKWRSFVYDINTKSQRRIGSGRN